MGVIDNGIMGIWCAERYHTAECGMHMETRKTGGRQWQGVKRQWRRDATMVEKCSIALAGAVSEVVFPTLWPEAPHVRPANNNSTYLSRPRRFSMGSGAPSGVVLQGPSSGTRGLVRSRLDSNARGGSHTPCPSCIQTRRSTIGRGQRTSRQA